MPNTWPAPPLLIPAPEDPPTAEAFAHGDVPRLPPSATTLRVPSYVLMPQPDRSVIITRMILAALLDLAILGVLLLLTLKGKLSWDMAGLVGVLSLVLHHKDAPPKALPPKAVSPDTSPPEA